VGEVIVRPGPASIPADAWPGGVVIHIYAVPSSRLVLVSKLADLVDVDARAEADADAAVARLHPGERDICLVAYDGDTGERIRWAG
jgi:hypothetical protein